MEKILFDSHSHISDVAFQDAEVKTKLIQSILDSEIKYCMDIGSSIATSKLAVASAKEYPFCYAAVGVHPSEVGNLSEEELIDCLEDFKREEKVVAVGEIGLDYHYDDGPKKDVQIKWFRRQLSWAIENDAPICIHSREADEDTLRVLKESGVFSDKRYSRFPRREDGSADARVLLHCFSSSVEIAKEYIKLGCDIALGGVVTFKNAKKAVEVASWIDLSRLLIETDCPYMAPEPFRGTTNTPVNVQYVAKKIADIKGISYEDVARETLKNACRFYSI